VLPVSTPAFHRAAARGCAIRVKIPAGDSWKAELKAAGVRSSGDVTSTAAWDGPGEAKPGVLSAPGVHATMMSSVTDRPRLEDRTSKPGLSAKPSDLGEPSEKEPLPSGEG
jgi:hypothetical protein